MANQSWDEMIEEFRALGGVADNVCQREGAYGRGMFPLDPGRPVTLRAPENLLLDIADARFENGVFRIGPNSKKGAREKTFIETYQNTFSWGGGGRAEIERIFAQAQELPEALREPLRAQAHYFGSWFGDVDEALIQKRFVESRYISYQGRDVLMPVVDLLNHSPQVETFDCGKGVSVHGTFPGEVLVRYTDADAYGVFGAWGFASDQPQAFSIGLKSTTGEFATAVSRDLKNISTAQSLGMPKYTKNAHGIAFQFLMIGNKKYPRLCKGIFYKLMREAQIPGFEEAFDKIQYGNLKQACDLMELLEKGDSPMLSTLRRVVSYQLRAMAHCFGVRAI